MQPQVQPQMQKKPHPTTIAVIDTSGVLEGGVLETEYDKAYIPPSVVEEMKCDKSKEWLQLNKVKLEIKQPSKKYVDEVKKGAEEIGCSLLSTQDLEVAALALELINEKGDSFSSWITPTSEPDAFIISITSDRTLKNLLAKYNILNYDGLGNAEKKYMQRCYTCGTLYKEQKLKDFCSRCGYSTIKRVSYSLNEKGEVVLHLSKNFSPKERRIFHNGKEIKGSDQKEYRRYTAKQKKQEKKEEKQVKEVKNSTYWEIE